MPLYWKFDSRSRSTRVVAEGPISRDDVVACFDAVTGAGAAGYRHLIDGREGLYSLPQSDLVAVGAGFRQYDDLEFGPVAVVLTTDQTLQLARLLGILLAAPRPPRLFRSVRTAERWLQALAPEGTQGVGAAEGRLRSPSAPASAGRGLDADRGGQRFRSLAHERA